MEVMSREELELRLDAVYGSAVDGIILMNQHGIIESLNHSACILFEYTSSELVGSPVKKLMPNPHQANHDAYISRYLETGEKHIIGVGREVEGLKKSGATFPFWLSVSEFRIGDRIIFTGFVHDISELKHAENEIRQLNTILEAKVNERTEQLADVVNRLLASNKKMESEAFERKAAEATLQLKQKELEQALQKEKDLSELKSRFVSMASHEFRTPLATIQSSAALVKRYAENQNVDKQRYHLEKIRNTVNNLTSILNDFLSLTKLEEGRIEQKPENIHLLHFCTEVTEEIKGLAKSGQAIRLDCPQDLHVTADPRLLQNVLYNLLSNAIKYSEKDIHFSVRTEGGYTLLEVSDQGCGIPAAEQPYLFDRFFRASNVTHIQGVGLGMNIVSRYLEIMEGTIRFQSREGKGTTFTIALPNFQHYPITTASSNQP
jgi:PAS domain S-box-containing protein